MQTPCARSHWLAATRRYLTLQGLQPFGHLARNARPRTAVDLGLLHPIAERLRRTADLGRDRGNRRPPGRMLPLVIEHQPHRAGADFRGKFVRRLRFHGSTFSRVRASDNHGAVQSPAGCLAEDAQQTLWGFRRCRDHGQVATTPQREDVRQLMGVIMSAEERLHRYGSGDSGSDWSIFTAPGQASPLPVNDQRRRWTALPMWRPSPPVMTYRS